MEQNIIIRGVPQKNKLAYVFIIVGVVLLLISFMVASDMFTNGEGYLNFGYGIDGWYYWCIIYDTFGEFFTAEFFNFDCYYGYIALLGTIALIVGIVIKISTENCEIAVTDKAVFGKIAHGKNVNIPLNQINAINRTFFNGFSITSIGNISNFYCIENCDEVIKTIAYLLTCLRQNIDQIAQSAIANSETAAYCVAERLKKIKELMDIGAITQEEFDAKKKEILGN